MPDIVLELIICRSAVYIYMSKMGLIHLKYMSRPRKTGPQILILSFSNVPHKCMKTMANLTVHYAIMYTTTKYTWLYVCYISQMTDN